MSMIVFLFLCVWARVRLYACLCVHACVCVRVCIVYVGVHMGHAFVRICMCARASLLAHVRECLLKGFAWSTKPRTASFLAKWT